MTARTTASKKGKARRLQQTVRDLLISELGIHADDILSAPMGLAGCDIVLSSAARAKCPFGIECKNQEVWKIPEWWRQCTTNADQENLSPLLVIKKNGKPPLVVAELYTFISLLADRVDDLELLELRRYREANREKELHADRPDEVVE